MISIIAAISENQVIGKDNKLVWHLPVDMKFFKNTTLGHTLIMGRKTFESFGKPLPGRKSIVITRNSDYSYEGVTVVSSLEQAIKSAPENEEVFIAGGAEIYKMALDIADRMYLTIVHDHFEGDTFFPEIDFSKWKLVSEHQHPADEKNKYAMSFRIFDRPERFIKS
jgi:dihydrofolate reductase